MTTIVSGSETVTSNGIIDRISRSVLSSPGNTAIGTVVGTRGFQYVEPGAITIGTVVNGGAEIVYPGGSAIGTIVNSGRVLAVEPFQSTATAIGTIINGGAESISGLPIGPRPSKYFQPRGY
jgi:autotransporter passenger strand-loop-strand repeat protein